MIVRWLSRRFNCPRCHAGWRCQCGFWATAAVVAGVVIAAAGTAYSVYSTTEAAAQQNAYAKRNAQMQEEAENAAGQARANQIEYDARKKQKSFLSRAAAAGISTESGSLLETETEFAFDTTYAKQLAQYPHQLAGWSDKYQSDLFGFQEKRFRSQAGMNAGIAAGSTLATGAARYYGSGGSTLNVGNQQGF